MSILELSPFWLIILAFFGFAFAQPWLRRWWQRRPVRDLPDDAPYKIFATNFDVEVKASEISNRLEEISWDHLKYWQRPNDPQLEAAISATGQRTAEIAASNCFIGLPAECGDMAVAILVDHSGSMRGGKIGAVCASVRVAVQALQERGAKVEVLGFTTAGWHGGRARELWQSAGRPIYPGRLCALLHIIYKSADVALIEDDAWHAMLNGGALYENVDGEALLWAAERLSKRQESRKILIILSDGAPVDDSTLQENGPSILHRHVLQVSADISAAGNVILGGLGVGHDISAYYRTSKWVSELTDLPRALAELMSELCGSSATSKDSRAS